MPCCCLVPFGLSPSGATAAARPFLGWLSVLWFLGARGSRGCGALVPVLSSCPSLAWAGLLSLGAWFALLWFLLSCGSFFVSNPEFVLSLFGCGARLWLVGSPLGFAQPSHRRAAGFALRPKKLSGSLRSPELNFFSIYERKKTNYKKKYLIKLHLTSYFFILQLQYNSSITPVQLHYNTSLKPIKTLKIGQSQA